MFRILQQIDDMTNLAKVSRKQNSSKSTRKTADSDESKPKLREVNTSWFTAKMEANRLNQRALAKALKVNPTTISLIVHGRRNIKLEEATILARELAVPLQEVLENAGVAVKSTKARDTMKVSGSIDGELKVHMGHSTVKGPLDVARPDFASKEVLALRLQTDGTKYEGINGALVYYTPSEGVNPDGIGRYCVVEITGKKGCFLRIVRRGYQTGTYNLLGLDGGLICEDVRLESASPVVWMKF